MSIIEKHHKIKPKLRDSDEAWIKYYEKLVDDLYFSENYDSNEIITYLQRYLIFCDELKMNSDIGGIIISYIKDIQKTILLNDDEDFIVCIIIPTFSSRVNLSKRSETLWSVVRVGSLNGNFGSCALSVRTESADARNNKIFFILVLDYSTGEYHLKFHLELSLLKSNGASVGEQSPSETSASFSSCPGTALGIILYVPSVSWSILQSCSGAPVNSETASTSAFSVAARALPVPSMTIL